MITSLNSSRVVLVSALALAGIVIPAGTAAAAESGFRIRSGAIDFAMHWPAEGKHAEMKDGSFAGGGVAIGDVTGDDLADVYLSRAFGGGRLYRNEGKWKFTDITADSGLAADAGNWASGCSMADADNDGDLDLAVCGYETANRLFLNDGKGKFREVAAAAGLAFQGASISLTWADFDRDGDLDAYLVTNRSGSAASLTSQSGPMVREIERQLTRDPATGALLVPEHLREEWAIVMKPGQPQLVKAGQRDILYRNDGPGADGVPRFTDITAAAGLTDFGRGLSAHWWDYNDDGFPDLYVANDFHGPDRLWHNNGNGTFTDKAPDLLRHTPWFSMGCDSGDLNNDGRLDFMASDMAGSNHYKDKMGMGDMDKQGWFLEMNVPRQYMRNAVYLNSGAGLPFMECAHQMRVAGTDWTWAVKFADMDCDGWQDIFITNGMTGDYLNSDLVAQNTAGGTVKNAPPKRDRDMAFRNTGGGAGAAWSFAFENKGKDWGLDREGISFGAAWGDLDADGDPDLVVNNFGEPCTVYENTTAPAEAGRLAVRLKGVKSNKHGIGARVTLTAGDLKQTRELSPVRGYFSSDEPVAFFGLGKAKPEKIEVRWPSGTVQTVNNIPAGVTVTLTESGDTPKPDQAWKPLFTASDCLPVPHSESNFDDFAVQPLLPNRLSREGPGHAWADVDGDGDFDLFQGGSAGDPGRLVFCNDPDEEGIPRFSVKSLAPFDADAKCEDMGVLFFDADSDGDDDLYVVSGGVEAGDDKSLYQDRLYLNDGKGTFAKAPAGTLPAETDSGSCVCAADFDHDGDLDLFVGGRVLPGKYPLSPGSRLLRNEGGTFKEATTPEMAKLQRVTAAVWTDLDGDSWPELATAAEWGSVRVFQNNQGKLAPADAGTGPFTGWWNSLSAADLDNDGKLDLIAGNYGLNTKYHPSPGHPQRIYYGDFDDSGTAQVVEAKTLADGTVLPMRGKSCSQQAMPMLSKKFPTFHSFASSDLKSIYTETRLATAQKFEAEHLESAIFWNETVSGEIRLKHAPLPPVAQIAPVFGIAVCDLDADGDEDVVLAQNSYSPQRETGWMDGGVSLLLRNVGQRSFTGVWPEESGIAVSADAKSLTLAVIAPGADSQPALYFGVNNGTAQVWRRTSPRPAMKTLTLRGPKGNLHGVGARVKFKTGAGQEVTREITAGAGFLSQSPPVLWIPGGVESVEVLWAGQPAQRHRLEPHSTSIKLP